MSLRTVLRFALVAILAAALADPVVAQVPNPWRLSPCPEAPMPRLKPRVVVRAEAVFRLETPTVTESQPAPSRPGLVRPGSTTTGVGHASAEQLFYSPSVVPQRSRSAAEPCVELPKDAPTGAWIETVWTLQPQPSSRMLGYTVGTPANARDVILATNQLWVQAARHATFACEAPTCLAPIQHDALPTRLAGSWCRDLGELIITATFAGDEMKVCLLTQEDGAQIRITLTADYGVSKEGLIHGVVTGIDVDVQKGPDADGGPSGREVAEFGAELQTFMHSPFSFRIKPTSAGIMVSDLKAAAEPMSAKELALACGMFKPVVDGQAPTPKVMKPSKARVGGPGYVLPDAHYLQHYPEYFAPDPQHPLPRELAKQEDSEGAPRLACGLGIEQCPVTPVRPMAMPLPPGEVTPARGANVVSPPCQGLRPVGVGRPASEACPYCPSRPAPMGPPVTWSPPKPGNVPPGDFGMMADVFGQMLGSPPPGRCESAAHPADVPEQMLSRSPDPVYPATLTSAAPRPLVPPSLPGSATRSIVGTWVREVGPLQYVVAITPERITVTARAATELDDGKTAVDGMILTAEYHLARDGVTVVGLVTGVDGRLEGELEGADVNALQEELARFQKALTDKPFAMSLRTHGDSLVMGNVRLPEVTTLHGGPSPLTALGGCYSAAGDGPPPKLRPVKACPMPPGQRYPDSPPFAVGPGLPPPGCPVSFPPQFGGGPGLPPLPRPGNVSTPPLTAPVVSGPLLLQESSDRIPPPTPRVIEGPALLPPQPVAETPKPGLKDGKKKGKKKKDVAADQSVERHPGNNPR